ncbi:MAG TPA: Rne/Rng family ribonuclease [Oscillatoriales cyanobacterium M59_W2019_021]|nr:MAG: Rne/Rng family ribonuclease [Cyanobacteria bacterium J055]HIK33452.1 Rne/Rng family ribonuclease [Oscillatoriales cyanobacterium M4454_W2019_049]HIK49973.1 Rne/Rng family ribonuclease [Oscillatoriales cyanobacterium M59_W2019_021]
MSKQIIIAEQHRISAVFSEDQIQELVVATGSHQVGDIYLGVVENVLPGIDAAFVNIGDSERNGFMHVTDLGPLRLKRSAGAITELVAPQQKVLVQVMKEPTGNKGPRLTGNITLPGRYLVLMPFGKGVHLSRRILKEAERNRLRALAILVKPAGMGLLVRTEAEGMSEDAIIEDLEYLQRRWESIQEEVSNTRAPALLNRDDDFIQRVLRDMYSTDVNRIVVDSHRGLKRVKQHLLTWNNGKLPPGVSIDHHNEPQAILEYFRVNAAIREALKPRVDLPSGGYVIIEPTEALTVIDVNSGSFTRSATARETVLWTNCEAATEIARQLRLRNIAGVIIVDFIDMDSRRDQLQVLEQFNKALRQDKARPQIAQLSELGLVELTRKRQGQNIYELFSRPCSACGGLGHVVALPGEAAIETTEVRVPEPRAIETRVKATLPTPVRENLEEGLELDAASDLQELDLIHHPSYQELGDGGGSRRRRRRRLVPDAGGTPRPIPGDSLPKPITSMPIPSMENRIIGLNPNLDDDYAASGEVDRPRKDRTKLPQRESIEPKEPPEMVTIEMTPEEQDIYAWMGVSPLVKLDRPLKNPARAIISIVLPGEASNGLQSPDTKAVELEEMPDSDDGFTPSVAEESEVRSFVEPIVKRVIEVEPVKDSTAEADTETDAEPEAEAEPANGHTLVRRRRRRSSASGE